MATTTTALKFNMPTERLTQPLHPVPLAPRGVGRDVGERERRDARHRQGRTD